MNKIIQFIKEAKNELKEKTTWPSREAVLDSTIVVIVSIIIVAAALFGVDAAVSWIMKNGLRDNIGFLRDYVNGRNFLIFVVAAVFVPIIYSQIKKKITQ